MGETGSGGATPAAGEAVGRGGRVHLVGAGPGAADLITVRGARLLAAADVVVRDALVDPALLEGLECPVIDVGKRAGRHNLGQEEINALLVRLCRQGKRVVRLKGGDPTVLGRGMEEALHLAARGLPCEIVPGVTSAVAAPALAGLPVTHRGLADSFTVLSAHPRDAGRPIAVPPYDPLRTVIVLMGVRTLPRWLARMREGGYPDELPVAFITWAGRPEQRALRSTLERAERDAALAGLRAPTVAVVGRVVTLMPA